LRCCLVSGGAYFYKTIMTCDNIFLELLKSFLNYYQVMNLLDATMFVAIGFVPTLIALEIVYRMGRAIGKRGEISSLAQHNKLKMQLFA
jgi:hypothetical protein